MVSSLISNIDRIIYYKRNIITTLRIMRDRLAWVIFHQVIVRVWLLGSSHYFFLFSLWTFSWFCWIIQEQYPHKPLLIILLPLITLNKIKKIPSKLMSLTLIFLLRAPSSLAVLTKRVLWMITYSLAAFSFMVSTTTFKLRLISSEL